MTLPPLTQRAVAALAADAIVVGEGGRLPTSLHYQETLGVGAGTVQQALRLLESSDALSVEARGHQGRHVVARDVGTLWSLGRLPPVRFVLPPPGSLELYGLLDGLAEQFRALGVPYEVAHRRGAEARVQMVADGDVDATFISRGASRTLGERIAAGALELRELGPDTYYADGSIVVLARPGVDRDADPATLRVGVDAESFDHAALTEAEFQRARGYAFVACRFPEIPVAVLDGRVDLGIWHRVLLLISPELAGLVARPLREPAALDARRELSPGVLVWASARSEVPALCRSLDGDAIRARQRRLLETRDPGVLSERYWLR